MNATADRIDRLLPDLIGDGLAANDRLKFYLTLLQMAKLHAEQPLAPVSSLREPREASGVSDPDFDDVVAASHGAGDGAIVIPHAARIRQLIVDDLHQMLAPLGAAAAAGGDADDSLATCRRRVDAQIAGLPSCEQDRIDAGAIDALTGAGADDRDTLHRVVMDLHRELNRLHERVASESINGARVLGLTDADRRLVRVFMKGLNRTAPLKFDHPGLGTTAIRRGACLSIQNDLGTTDAHIVVFRISGLDVTLTYSDIHPRRAQFFQESLEAPGIEWHRGAPANDGGFVTLTGAFTAPTASALERLLTKAASRLVFLIDWNRARKRLTRFVRKPDAVTILTWAADRHVGHRAFLQAGDAQLIYTALERCAPARLRFGARLDEVIGREAAIEFLKAVLRITSAGLAAGRSRHLMEDEIEAELVAHLRTPDQMMLAIAAEHAMLVWSLADRVRSTIARALSDDHDEIGRVAALAKTWETRADAIVARAARVYEGPDRRGGLHALVDDADDIADALEDAAFQLTLLPGAGGAATPASLTRLADLAAEAVAEYVRCLEAAKGLSPRHARADVEDVLRSVDRVLELEHECDAAERATKSAFVTTCGDFRELSVLTDLTRGLERASDATARCARLVRDYVLAAGRP